MVIEIEHNDPNNIDPIHSKQEIIELDLLNTKESEMRIENNESLLNLIGDSNTKSSIIYELYPINNFRRPSFEKLKLYS